MSNPGLIVNTTIRRITRLICRVDDAQLERVPPHGPLILVANHINFLEVPLVYTHLLPRPVTGFAKAETWDNPAMRPLFNLWKAIPLQREEVDLGAMRRALEVLKTGGILAVAPEGTRSSHGRLQRGKPGIVMLALRSGAPLLPMVYYGGEHFRHNITRLRRTDFHIVTGYSFYLSSDRVTVTRQTRQDITDEIMYQLAALLPPTYRGFYADLEKATENYLRFIPPAQSNLKRLRSPEWSEV
jgi:1-acyl-sn-glycerol-3-phosphate acyltransferase